MKIQPFPTDSLRTTLFCLQLLGIGVFASGQAPTSIGLSPPPQRFIATTPVDWVTRPNTSRTGGEARTNRLPGRGQHHPVGTKSVRDSGSLTVFQPPNDNRPPRFTTQSLHASPRVPSVVTDTDDRVGGGGSQLHAFSNSQTTSVSGSRTDESIGKFIRQPFSPPAEFETEHSNEITSDVTTARNRSALAFPSRPTDPAVPMSEKVVEPPMIDRQTPSAPAPLATQTSDQAVSGQYASSWETLAGKITPNVFCVDADADADELSIIQHPTNNQSDSTHLTTQRRTTGSIEQSDWAHLDSHTPLSETSRQTIALSGVGRPQQNQFHAVRHSITSPVERGRMAAESLRLAEVAFGRGTPLLARSHASDALMRLAEWTDAIGGHTQGTRSLSNALTTLRECADFARFNTVEPQALHRLVRSHQTVSWSGLSFAGMSRQQVIQAYHQLAESQLERALPRNAISSRALVLMARTESEATREDSPVVAGTQACLLRIAMVCHPENPEAGNLLATALIDQGLLEQAQRLLESTCSTTQSTDSYRLLGTVYAKLGFTQQAAHCNQIAATAARSRVKKALVVNVGPGEFAAYSQQQIDMGTPDVQAPSAQSPGTSKNTMDGPQKPASWTEKTMNRIAQPFRSFLR